MEAISVLLVEDNPEDARRLMDAVAEADARILKLVRAETLEQTLERLGAESFDVVLLDLSLPDASGLEALEKTHARAPGVPIVVMTAVDDEALAMQALREGAQDFLVKSRVSSHRLLRAMRYATERQHAVKALERSEEHFRSLIENALDIITILDDKGTIVYASPSIEHVLGYKPADLLGNNALDFVHAADAAGSLESFRNDLLGSGSPRTIEFRFRHKEGSWRVLEAIGKRMTAEGGGTVVINARDITERKRVENALLETTETLAAVIRASPLAIVTLDLAGNVKSWSAAARRIFGWSEEDVLGRPMPAIVEEDRENFRTWLKAAGQGQVQTGEEKRYRREDGSPIDVSVWTAPLRDARGDITGIVKAIADITEGKLLEEQLRHSQKMEAVGRLAGGVAHDFNNLLTIITGYSQMLLARLAPGDSATEDMEQVLKAADRAAGLTKQLLAFSRRQIVQPKILDLNALVRDMERMLQRVIGEDVELLTVLESELKKVKADPGQMEQVVLNLTVNARDAMPEGGRLTIETANVFLEEQYVRTHLMARAGEHVMLAVSDTGVGIDEEARAHLFEPFFTTKERGKGTGLGLSTSYGIVKQSGGDIWVQSEPGAGTTFKIYLPVAEETADLGADPGIDRMSLQGAETVLLVEDEEGVRMVVRDILRKHGYKILPANGPLVAIDICEKYQGNIDLLLTDVVMPHMNGRDLADRLRTLRPAIKVLYVSGYTDRSVVEREIEKAGTAFLQKPFTPDALALKLREVLRGG